MGNQHVSRFQSDVEAVRSGTIFAHNADAYGRWRRSVDSEHSRALSPEGLEVAVRALAASNPEYVVVGP